MTLEEIGRLLRETREKKGLTLHDVQVATKIRMKYLEAIERGDDRQLPAEVYTKGFIRAYASFLQLNGLELARAYAEWKHGRAVAARAGSEGPGGTGATGDAREGTGEDRAGGEPDAAEPAAPEPAAGDAGVAAGAGGGRVEPPFEPAASSPGGTRAGARREAGPGRGRVAGAGAEGGSLPSRAARGGVPLPPETPLIPPFPAGGRRRGRAADWPVPAYGAARRRGGPWGLILALGLALAAVVAVGLYYAGAPDAPPGQSGTGTSVDGGGQQGAPGGGQPGGSQGGGGTGSPGQAGGGTQQGTPPGQEPPAAGPEVLVERSGDDVRYEVRAAATAGGAAGGGAGEAVPVVLSATADVWVRVRDEEGRVVFERLMRGGDRQELELRGELRIRVGFPRGLEVNIGGRDVDVPDEESPLNLIVERAGS